MINICAITNFTRADIGRPVTYQCAGMSTGRYGHISGLSDIEGMVFVKWLDQSRDNPIDFYNMRWGFVEPWIK